MDYRVKITIRNNRILKAIEEQGYHSVSDFCRKFNLSITSINSLISGKIKPLLKNGKICPLVENLLDYLNLSLEEAFTEKQLGGFYKNSFQIEMKESQLTSLASPIKNIELLAMEQDVNETLRNLMIKTLSPREEQCVRSYFFQNKTLSIIAKEHSVTMERARQIIKKSLRKLSTYYGELKKSGVHDVFPKLAVRPDIKIIQPYSNDYYIMKKQKEERNDHVER